MKQFSSEKKFLDKILTFGKSLPEEMIIIAPGLLISMLRKRLRMSQKYLAQKLGVSQPYIARIESGKSIPSNKTLKRIFNVMGCSFAIILIPEKMPDEILQEQAKKIAQKRIQYVEGTMSLESQLPSREDMKELLIEEEKKLLSSTSEKLWEIEDEK